MDNQQEIKRMRNSGLIILLGTILISLCLVALYFASEATKYSRDFDSTQERMDLFLKRLRDVEDTMAKINVYSDAIDELTLSSISKNKGDNSAVAKINQVDQMIAKLKAMTKDVNNEENLNNRLEEITTTSERLDRTLSGLIVLLKHHQAVFNSIPTITPAEGYVSSNFGVRNSPFSGDLVKHEGLDIGADEGTFVRATADGVIEFAGNSDTFGKLIVVKHDYGIWTRYAHNSKINVIKGQRVLRGQDIAKVGSTGRSTGPHLHYEVWVNRKPVNPQDYLLDRQLQDIDITTGQNFRQMGGEETKIEGAAVALPKAKVASTAQPKMVLAAKTSVSQSALVNMQAPTDASQMVQGKSWNWRKSLASLLFGFSIMAAMFVFVRPSRSEGMLLS